MSPKRRRPFVRPSDGLDFLILIVLHRIDSARGGPNTQSLRGLFNRIKPDHVHGDHYLCKGEITLDRDHPPFIAIGRRLEGIPEVLTLGVKANYMDYTPNERKLMESADLILYPTLNFAQFFTTMGKKIFPSLETHLYADEKIKQTTLYYMMGISHPRTRFYYRRHHGDILRNFMFPFVAKLPRASSQGRGVYLINNSDELEQYLHLTPVAYIQEYLPHDRDLRVILIDYQPILAYWRKSPPGNFRTNIFQGGTIHFEDIPHEVLAMAQDMARKCHFDDVGLDFIQNHGKWYLIEANMKYGRKALRSKGMDLKAIIRDRVLTRHR